MLSNIGLFTYLPACLSFAILAGLLLRYWHVQPLGPTLFAASLASSLWGAVIALGTLAEYPPLPLIHLAEFARNACWLYLLLQLLGLQIGGNPLTIAGNPWRRWFWLLQALALALLVLPFTSLELPAVLSDGRVPTMSIWMVSAVAGLLLIEQLFRNANQAERWSMKYLLLGLGTVFVLDFLMYAEAILFRGLDSELWWARGLINAAVSPWLAIAIARNESWNLQLHVSRRVVFHSVTLTGAGLYLLAMAAVGYYIKYLGGTWGGVLQMAFIAIALGFLLSLILSGRFRALLRVQLSKHFFSYHYDYREEWLNFTRSLSSLGANVPEGLIRTMASLTGSQAGVLWGRSDEHGLLRLAEWQMPPGRPGEDNLGQLPAWLSRTGWVIDLREWRSQPELYGDLDLPPWLREESNIWLIIPLLSGEGLTGVLMLGRSDLKPELNWEDRDLLKTAGRQAASYLAQHLANEALVQARQFDAFNRLSAYLVHDLKNILAQQSLLVSNARKHRQNPAFVDDMIETVENSVARMRRLMEQLRAGIRTGEPRLLDFSSLLEGVIRERSAYRPVPELDMVTGAGLVLADEERLKTVFNHIIQNAQEATDAQGRVTVNLRASSGQLITEICDTGHGMTGEFIRDRLFQPFESTKGLTGMGIGVFESREYIRQIGGDIQVASQPGVGTRFTISLPLADNEPGETEQPQSESSLL